MTNCPYCGKHITLFDDYRFTEDSPIHAECYKRWKNNVTYCSNCKEKTHTVFVDGLDDEICSRCGRYKKAPEDLKKR